MTNQRICDVCNRIIPNKTDYIKLTLISHKDKKLIYHSVGHMCLTCLEQKKNERQEN